MRVSADKNYVTDSAQCTAEQIYESVAGLILKAINENQRHKIETMGNFLGETVYSGDFSNNHELQQMTNTLVKLSWRQLVLIKLISEKFHGIDSELIPLDPSASIEINELQQYGFWQSEGARFGVDNSSTYQLKDIKPTEYCYHFVEKIGMDFITVNDVNEIVGSLRLGHGQSPENLTADEVKTTSSWREI